MPNKSKPLWWPVFFILIMGLSMAVPAASLAAALDLKGVIRKVEQQYNGNSSHITARLDIITEQWKRSVSVEGWSLGRNYSLTRVLKPVKEQGITTLKAGREVWNYLPRVDRVIKIPPSMMGSPWMGSHISNDDLVKSSHVDVDYDLSLIQESSDRWQIACLPKPDVPVIWGKIIYTIEKVNHIPVEVVYFDDLMVKVRTMYFDDVQKVSNHVLPMRMTVQPHDKPEEKTVLQYVDIRFDIPIEESFFSLSNLKSR
jgi:hypothetical protein